VECAPRNACSGLTIFELIITMGVVGLLAAISAEIYGGALYKARVTRAMADIRTIDRMITSHSHESGDFPSSLDDLDRGMLLDPWGNRYQYLNFAEAEDGGDGGLPGKASQGPLSRSAELVLRPLQHGPGR
jgi:type II secretory pathway pseudopilin PulG